MKSIKEEIITSDLINKSKFINHLIPVSSLEAAKLKLNEIKKQYSDASHHCFAYIIGNNQEVQKYSDDGEPSKTAGFPIMEVLKKHDLTNVLSVTIRYYGGVNLGAGGLTRAYTKSCAESISEAKFTNLKKYSHILIRISFDQIGHVEKYLRDNFELINTKYDTHVNYIVNIESSLVNQLESSISEFTSGSSIINTINEYDIYR